MGISAFRVQQLLKITILSLALLAGFPGTGKAVKRLKPPLNEPKAFRQLDASVTSLRFFATPAPRLAPNQAKVYTTSFMKGDTHYIWWEMCLKTNAKRDRIVPLYIYVTWQRPDGSEFYQSVAFNLPPDFDKPCMWACEQDKRPGGWAVGSYHLTIQIDDIQVASGSFEVFQKVFEGPQIPEKKF
jgi:hypothetical protein